MGLCLFSYLARLYLRWFAGVLGVFSLFAFLIDFFELQRRTIAGSPLSILTKCFLVCLKIPFILEQLMPFLTFVAALGILWRLNHGNEILILRSFGLSSWRIASPFLAVALLLGVVNLTAFQPFSVFLFQNYQRKEAEIFQRNPSAIFQVLPSGFWIKKRKQGKDFMYHIQNIRPETSVLEGFSVYVLDESLGFQASYSAQKAVLSSHKIAMTDVWIMEKDAPVQHLDSHTLPLHLTLKDLYKNSPNPQWISFWRLPSLIRWMEKAGLSPHKYQLELQRLIALSVWFSGMVLLAVSCGLRSQKRGSSLLLLLCGLAGSLVLYFIRDVAYALGSARYLPMVLASWTPCILTFLIAFLFLLFLEEGQRSRLI